MTFHFDTYTPRFSLTHLILTGFFRKTTRIERFSLSGTNNSFHIAVNYSATRPGSPYILGIVINLKSPQVLRHLTAEWPTIHERLRIILTTTTFKISIAHTMTLEENSAWGRYGPRWGTGCPAGCRTSSRLKAHGAHSHYATKYVLSSKTGLGRFCFFFPLHFRLSPAKIRF